MEGLANELRANLESHLEILKSVGCDELNEMIHLLEQIISDIPVTGSQVGGGKEAIFVWILFIYLFSFVSAFPFTVLDHKPDGPEIISHLTLIPQSTLRSTRVTRPTRSTITLSKSEKSLTQRQKQLEEHKKQLEELKETVKEYAVIVSNILPNLMKTKHMQDAKKLIFIFGLADPNKIVYNINGCLDMMIDSCKSKNNIISLFREIKFERRYSVSIFTFAKRVAERGIKKEILNIGFFFWSISFVSDSLTIINKYWKNDVKLLKDIKEVMKSFDIVSKNNLAAMFLEKYYKFLKRVVNIMIHVVFFINENLKITGGRQRKKQTRRKRKFNYYKRDHPYHS